MAEILVRAFDSTHADPKIDLAGCYKRGDLVVVADDGHEWGASERLPKFWQVRITNVSKAQAEKYTASVNRFTDIVLNDTETTVRRRYTLNVDAVAAFVTDPVIGRIEGTWQQLRNALIDKTTGLAVGSNP